jgi:two-component system response regulator DesR
VALLDIEMPGADGITAAAELRKALPSCRAVILTTFGRPGFLRRAMDAGAVGLLLKDAPPGDLASGWRSWSRAVDSLLAREVECRSTAQPLPHAS